MIFVYGVIDAGYVVKEDFGQPPTPRRFTKPSDQISQERLPLAVLSNLVAQLVMKNLVGGGALDPPQVPEHRVEVVHVFVAKHNHVLRLHILMH